MKDSFPTASFQKIFWLTGIFLIVIILFGWVGKNAYARYLARKVATAVATEMKLESISYKGTSFSLLKRELFIYELELYPTDDPRPIKISRMDLKGYYGGDLDENFHLYLSELVFPTDMASISWLGEMFHDLGYAGIVVNIKMACTIRDDHVIVWPLMMEAKGVFRIEAYADIESIRLTDYWMAQQHPVLLTLFLANASLVEGSLKYKDEGMMERLLLKKAKLWGDSPQAVKWQLHQEAKARIEREPDATKRRSLQALMDFVQDPTSIQLELRSSKKLTLASLVDAWADGSMDSIVDSIIITYPVPTGGMK